MEKSWRIPTIIKPEQEEVKKQTYISTTPAVTTPAVTTDLPGKLVKWEKTKRWKLK